jgi:hypothetical protein
MRYTSPDYASEYADADQELPTSGYIGSLPVTPAPVVAAPAFAPTAPKPTDAMLRGEEYSSTPFEGMEPIYEGGTGRVSERGAFLGYGYKYSQLPGYGMVPVYQAQQSRGADRGPPVLLGYEFNPQAAGLTIEDAPKPPEILHCIFINYKYEPELFPGLIYRMLNPKIVLLIFVSGKCVLTGAKVQSLILGL